MENKLKKSVKIFIWVFTLVVFALVSFLHGLPKIENTPIFIKLLPAFNASINATSFVLLLVALALVKAGKIEWHKRVMTTTMILAVLFLVSYVTNHAFSGDTFYGGEYKNLYYFVLISHIILAGVSLPFILFSYAYGFYNLRDKHKKWVRITYPLWLYVTFTGVMVFLFLAPYYE